MYYTLFVFSVKRHIGLQLIIISINRKHSKCLQFGKQVMQALKNRMNWEKIPVASRSLMSFFRAVVLTSARIVCGRLSRTLVTRTETWMPWSREKFTAASVLWLWWPSKIRTCSISLHAFVNLAKCCSRCTNKSPSVHLLELTCPTDVGGDPFIKASTMCFLGNINIGGTLLYTSGAHATYYRDGKSPFSTGYFPDLGYNFRGYNFARLSYVRYFCLIHIPDTLWCESLWSEQLPV